MRKIIILLLVGFALFAGQKQSIKVMPLGDSITFGSYGAGMLGRGGYREILASKCVKENLSVDFVGTLHYPENAGFDSDNNGLCGWRANQINDSIKVWITKCKPQIILLQIGVNDIIQGASVDTAVARLDKLIFNIHTADKNIVLYTASIMNVLDSNLYKVKMPMVNEYNSKIEILVKKHLTSGMKIHFADINTLSALGASDFHKDRLHPNDKGYSKMADAWWSVLKQYNKILK
jgi:lysophospholipase L1-like esterase